MRTLVVNNQKGGVGKTTLAVHAAWRLAELGSRVLFVDLDPQANGSFTLSQADALGPSYELFAEGVTARSGGPATGVTVLCATRELDSVDQRMADAVIAFRRNFTALMSHFDVAVIDTPPTWSGRNYAALMVATTLVTPIDLETYALQGVRQLMAQKLAVEKGARQGRPIDFLGLLPSRFQSNSPRQRANLETLIRHQGATLLFPNSGVLTQRQAYAEAVDVKKPVWTLKKTAAQTAGREMLFVLDVIRKRLLAPMVD